MNNTLNTADAKQIVLVTGATGYIGGRLLHKIDRSKYHVRCLARKPEYLLDRIATDIEVVRGDVRDKHSLLRALQGVHIAFYLIHSMGSSGDFEEEDRKAAQKFGEAAKECGIQRIIYLGGLGDPGSKLSSHLRSRQEVGEILRSSGVPIVELRASIVIGSESLSFELIRALTERLPLMITPRWVAVPAQPIGIEDLLQYLLESMTIDTEGSAVYEIGGRDVVSYGDLIREYARQRNLRRYLIPVPVLTPRLSSLWLRLVTPLHLRIGRKLIEGMRHPTVVRDSRAGDVFKVVPMSVREAIVSALHNEDREFAATRWTDALSSSNTQRDWGGVRFGNRLVDSRTIRVRAKPGRVFSTIERVGGKNGWYYANLLWQLRGFIDLLVGGVGLRRGRSHPTQLRPGDVVDCWRVEAASSNRSLRLEAEMKLPGRAWLEFELSENGENTTLRQTAIFDPVGLFGLIYWYALYPIHQIIFAGMIRGIASASQHSAKQDKTNTTEVPPHSPSANVPS
ncbi:MAG: DUF2867 domain-containing protein [Candidatus Latescibacteria bacterium]|nr:DUF2867 domain-containing protein [Candidatus Latescibacterota bacterium]NIO56151.1 DUF2867 domain-containing protein [Candidatus Latescibacterota bacterium]